MIERRYVNTDVAIRSKADGGHVIDGYAAKFNKLSQNLGGFVEQIAPGAFTKTIQEADIRALFNHEPGQVLGRNKSGTLRVSEDGTGLYYEIDLPNTTLANDLRESMLRGDVNQSSFGFSTVSDEWGLTEQDIPLRTLKEVKLYDVSPVTFPAYLDTESGVVRSTFKSLAEVRHMNLDEVVTAAAHDELRAVILGDTEAQRPDQSTVIPLATLQKRAALEQFRAEAAS